MVLKIILLLSYILSAVISIKLILENRDPSKTIIWILIFMLFPVVGIVIYAILGRNIRKLKINKASKMADNMKKENILSNKEATIHIIMHLIFILDVISSIIIFNKARKEYKKR